MSWFLSKMVDVVWGPPLVTLLIGGGLYLLTVSRFLPLTGMLLAFRLVGGFVHHQSDQQAVGQISHFRALTNALAATVGMGNIAGVAIAIHQGGPGAVFWMWITALIGMNTKFFECSLAVMYRGKDFQGEVQGGPMYVIQAALPKWMMPFAIAFSIFGMIGCMGIFNANQMAAYFKSEFGWDPYFIGITSALVVGYALMGGIRRLAAFTAALVPSMCLVYVLCCLAIIVMNFDQVPATFGLIFSKALSLEALTWGALGEFFRQMMVGVKRAAFSNEAGIGTAPMAHSNAHTAEPISEGLVAMLGPFFDTILVCTMTALVILTAAPEVAVNEGILLTKAAFVTHFGSFGSYILGLSVFLFSFTTMLGMANYNEKCWDFLFRGRWGFGRKTFIVFFCTTIWVGSFVATDDVVNILDIGYALMAFPNMIATIWLASRVKQAMVKYLAEYN